MKLRVLALVMIALCLACVPAVAQVDLYDNGPTDGTTDAWAINFGFVISDMFTLSSSANVVGLSFAAWLFPGDILESAEVSITSSEFGGTSYFDRVVSFTQHDCALNQIGFNVCQETGSFDVVPLNAGNYWLNLQNAVANSGNPVYWDENRGPSFASENGDGTLPSESFTILGETGETTTGTGTAPEPGGLMLLGSGVIGAVGLLRRKLL
jgi:hypothetical protein